MTTQDIKKNIIPYLGETAPYISVPENIIFNSNRLETSISDYSFNHENFSKLIKLLSSLGSCNLYKLLNPSLKEQIYFMGEKVRIRQLSYKNQTPQPLPAKVFWNLKEKVNHHFWFGITIQEKPSTLLNLTTISL